MSNNNAYFIKLVPIGSSPFSVVVNMSSKVGLPAVLPCSVASHLEFDQTPHIQWHTLSYSVFERMGPEQFQGEAYRDRADVPEELLVRGNCSLFLQDVRFSDAGIYDSYLVYGESNIKNRIFIQSVHLAVIGEGTLILEHSTVQSISKAKGSYVCSENTNRFKKYIFIEVLKKYSVFGTQNIHSTQLSSVYITCIVIDLQKMV